MKTTAHHPPPNKGSVRILLCGYGHLGLALLEGLLGCGDQCELVGVFRWSSRRGSENYWEPVEGVFQKRVAETGLKDIRCKGMNSYEFADILQQLKPDVVLVGSWGEILRRHVLDEARPILINCHPSKLPAHRGANPYSSVIRTEEIETGVTFHRMATQIDAGAIILQQTIPLTTGEDGASVRDKCAMAAQAIIPELVRLLNDHLAERSPLPQIEQDPSQQSYFSQLKPEDGALQWEDTAEAMHRQIRSLFPWIACYGVLEGRRPVIFYDPRFVVGNSQGQAPGTILSLQRGTLQIALADNSLVLEVSSYQFGRARARQYWPLWFSQILAPFILQPGKRFITPQLKTSAPLEELANAQL
jgi:methionyl-tRNA formyltransferase